MSDAKEFRTAADTLSWADQREQDGLGERGDCRHRGEFARKVAEHVKRCSDSRVCRAHHGLEKVVRGHVGGWTVLQLADIPRFVGICAPPRPLLATLCSRRPGRTMPASHRSDSLRACVPL